jgi:8-oxo-dGTP pyrophosphatase MutT (NUDIX family)
METLPRQRASAIVIRGGKILLVRDRDRPSFALPGGGIDGGELPIAAIARELYEETTLVATSVTYLFQHGGKRNNHHVFQVVAEGEVSVANDLHVEEFVWWDRIEAISVFPHVLEILKRLQGVSECHSC